jgi:hypothetical protein
VRRTRHRRRFHTDRIVAVRRARWVREHDPRLREYVGPIEVHRAEYEWRVNRLTHGRLTSTDPWDCGRSSCSICAVDRSRGARENRE